MIGILLRLIRKAKFGKWIKLEDRRSEFLGAVDKNADDLPDTVYAYISTALGLRIWGISSWGWLNVITLFTSLQTINLAPAYLPILQFTSLKIEKNSWEYDGRNYHYYAHLLAQEYGWTLEYIYSLDTESAIALIQEILTSEQLEKEFQWSMTEIAYPYNKDTKKSNFIPLERPSWMKPKPKEIKTIRMKKSLIPVGKVIRFEDKAKEAKSEGNVGTVSDTSTLSAQ